MKRLLCIWFPNWPIQRLLVANPALERRAIVLFGRDPRRGPRVVACSRKARQHGVRIGMPLAEATVLLEHLGIWPHSPAVDRQALEHLVTWAEAFSPLVGLDERPTPAGLLLDLTGVAARHGGEVALTEQLQAQLRQRGYWGQLGLADTLGAAWALAHFGHLSLSGEIGSPRGMNSPGEKGSPGETSATSQSSRPTSRRWIYIAGPGQTRQALARLPVAALRLGDRALEWLHELGVQRVEQLWDLPRAGVSSRLGSEVLQRLDQALGRCEEMYSAYQPPRPFVTQWQGEYATDRYETIERVVEHLSHHLAQLLSRQQQGALQLRCCLHCEPHVVENAGADPLAVTQPAPVALDVSLFQPTLQANYLWQLLQRQLESTPLPGPVVSVELQAIATTALGHHQPQLWDTDSTRADASQLASLIDRVSNRLGPSSVCAARLRASALPEAAYALIPLAGPEASVARLNAGSPRTLPAPDHRPLKFIHPPLPLQMLAQSPQGAPLQFVAADSPQQVVGCWGPERIETAWWQGPCVRRDYYRVHCAAGGRFWLFRNLVSSGWFLHGEFI